jgi:hypothetical protein
MTLNEPPILSNEVTDAGIQILRGDMSDKNLRLAAEAFRTARDSRRTADIGRGILEIMVKMSYERDTTRSKLELSEHFDLVADSEGIWIWKADLGQFLDIGSQATKSLVKCANSLLGELILGR